MYTFTTVWPIDEMFIFMMCVYVSESVSVCVYFGENDAFRDEVTIYGNHFITQPLKCTSWNIIFDFSFDHNQIITKYHSNVPLNFRPLDSYSQHSTKMYVYFVFSHKKVRILHCPPLLRFQFRFLYLYRYFNSIHFSPYPCLTFDLIYQTFYLLQCIS